MAWPVLNPDQGAALQELLQGDPSDRIVAIVGGAILDNSLMHALSLRLRANTNTKIKILKVGGALGNLGPKIDMGYLLYMIDKQIREAMYSIEFVRNSFAHNLAVSFTSSDDKLKKAMKSLTLHQDRSHYMNPFTGKDSQEADMEIGPVNSPRERFLVNLKICLLHLMRDQRMHRPWSNLLP